MAVHTPEYQARDFEVVDYDMYALGDTDLEFRGPIRSLTPGGYIACIGAAQTFGCLCPRPFPTLIEEYLDLPVLNLGYGGAGPGFFLKHPGLLPYINGARVTIVQVMSGRSVSNSRFDSGGLEYLVVRADGRGLGARPAYAEVIEGPDGEAQGRLLLAETHANWKTEYGQLIGQIRTPTILLWFSQRTPDYTAGYGSVSEMFGQFPQLVNREMVESIRSLCDAYVECVTSAGLPQTLYSRFTGQVISIDPSRLRPDLGHPARKQNGYYPSPEMHGDAAAALTPALQRLLASSQAAPG